MELTTQDGTIFLVNPTTSKKVKVTTVNEILKDNALVISNGDEQYIINKLVLLDDSIFRVSFTLHYINKAPIPLPKEFEIVQGEYNGNSILFGSHLKIRGIYNVKTR